jgi:hypothetical protein
MKPKYNSPFSFINSDSIIDYEEVHHNIESVTNVKDPKFRENIYYLYDKQSDRFIYFYYNSNIFIFNSKGQIEKYSKFELTERIKIAAAEYTCRFLLLLTSSNKAIICELKHNEFQDYNIFDKGEFLGGFFIRRKPEKDNKYCKLCMVSKKNFIISKIYLEKTEKGLYEFKRKNVFTSKEIKVLNYFYNSDFNAVIFRVTVCDFLLVNLKSKCCYETFISLNHINTNNIMTMSMFLVRNIYNKLYLIHMNAKNIEFYGLKDLKKKKSPKIIKLDFGVYYQNIRLQFTQNLIFIYNDINICVYDIKCKENNKILTIDYRKNKDYLDFYKKIKVYGDYVAINNNFYRTKFFQEKFYNKNIKQNKKETILITLRRDNTKNIIKKELTEIVENYDIAFLYDLLTIMIKNNGIAERKINYDKKNAYQIISSGKNYFYVNSDEIFNLFSRKIGERDPVKVIQFMGILFKLYENENIKLDNDIFVSTLFYHLNKIKDLSFFESLFKNGLIPINHKLGLYLIDRAIHLENKKDKKERDILYNIGINNLMAKNDDEGMKEVVDELIDQEKYEDCFDYISYYLCQRNYNEQGTFQYLKNFMANQFNKKKATKADNENETQNQNNKDNVNENDNDKQENEDEDTHTSMGGYFMDSFMSSKTYYYMPSNMNS